MVLSDLEQSRILRPKQQAAKDYIASRKSLISQTQSLRGQGATTQQVADFVQGSQSSIPHTPYLPMTSTQTNVAELKKYAFTPEPIKTGGVSTVNKPISFNNLITNVPDESRVASSIAKNISTQNMTPRPQQPAYNIITAKFGGSSPIAFLTENEQQIAVNNQTGQKYVVVKTNSTNTLNAITNSQQLTEAGADYKTFLIPYNSVNKYKYKNPEFVGLNTSQAIDLETGKTATPQQAQALIDLREKRRLGEKSYSAAAGLSFGMAPGTKAIGSATAKAIGSTTKLTTAQMVRNLGLSLGGYVSAPFMPEGARQIAIATNPDAKGIDLSLIHI